MFKGQSLQLQPLDGGFVELRFDREGAAINKFDADTLDELRQAGRELAQAEGIKGLLVTSAKNAFIVGADITEFGKAFEQPPEDIAAWVVKTNEIFSAIEDLPFPSVAAVNGLALGGGFEMALSADYRVMATAAKLGFPEVKLGIIPGFGGTVRFPRLVGADNAIEWISGGTQNRADKALKVGAVDAVVEAEKLHDAALQLLKLAAQGKYDWQARRAQKKAPLQLDPVEAAMVFQTSLGFIQGKAGKNYPAPVQAVKCIQKAAGKSRDEALKIEAEGFATLAKTTASDALIGLFLNDQLIKKKGKAFVKAGKKVERAAVLGAGIMGGGISYQSAVKGTPVVMKDIADAALDLGMSEANKLLAKQVARGKLNAAKAGEILGMIRPTLNYGDFKTVDVVVEAVVENPKVKKAVLAEVEGQVKDDAILASNTSSISIDELASALKRPENFLGMHFFNPVHRMPLVEVIYGEK
ncbi:MAG: 3-hydroxyacyl-CoA dehydrogenase NAD-binding domain-containing protein, partial [Sinobacteraceae bacterium]|nr:3-hydroxyacyl-CoA dehydrogenase NAD-binding domain-containing protein [Nevskiaceae bacterium]